MLLKIAELTRIYMLKCQGLLYYCRFDGGNDDWEEDGFMKGGGGNGDENCG